MNPKKTKMPQLSMTDDEAVIAMVDSNVQREEILPSERAWSLKMKLEAITKQGKRTDLEDDSTSRTECEKLSADQVGETMGLKARQVQKYIRLTELIPPLMNLVDEKKITISYILKSTGK